MNKKIKVLVIRFSSIGDIVLCTPVVRCLKKIPNTDTEVHFITKKSFAGFVGNNPHIDKVYALEGNIKNLIADLKQQNYDFIIDLHNNWRSHMVKLHLRKPSKTFHKLNIKKWLLTRFKINMMPDIHIVERYLDTIKPLGAVNDNQGLEYFIPPNDEIDLNTLPESFQQGYLGFVIGGTYATKRLPDDKIIALCQKISMPIVLLGGPEDRAAGENIAKHAGDHVYNSCGKFSLNSSASLVKQAMAIVSHDTGLMHIAAAFNKPVASVWGNTVPEFGMYPYLPMGDNQSRIFEVKGLDCRPCSKLGYNKCPKKHFKCMNEIPLDEIEKWVNSFKAG
jgi:ADP-heptose:LPS heptosyltransferase